jgi:hypothetical protein
MTREQKALRACAEYARLGTEIRELTREIGNALSQCVGIKGQRDAYVDPSQGTIYSDNDADHSHLKEVFTPYEDYNEHGYRSKLWMDKDEIRYYLTEDEPCAHCLRAYEAVIKRKASRRALGHAKRSISLIGRAAAQESV